MNKNTWKIVIRPMGALAAAAILMASVPSWGLAQVQAAAQAQAEPGRQAAVRARSEPGYQAAAQAWPPLPRTGRFFEGVDFSQRPYEHFSTTVMDKAMEEFELALNTQGQEEEVERLYDLIISEFDRLATMTYMAQIEYDKDVSNEAAAQEQAYTTDLYAELGDKAASCISRGLATSYANALEDRIGGEYVSMVEYYQEDSQERQELDKKEQELLRQYDQLAADDITVEYNGQRWNYQRLETEEDLSTDTYRDILKELSREKNRILGNKFMELVQVRDQIAGVSGYDNYAEYAYNAVYGRDYTMEDAKKLCGNVKDTIVPLNDDMWYLDVDYASYDSLDELESSSAEDMFNAVGPALVRTQPELGGIFQYMRDNHLYDIQAGAEGEDRADSSYTVALPSYKDAFIFINRSNTFRDYQSLIHEFGHFSSYYYNAGPELYQGFNVDVCEIQSQGLELLVARQAESMLGEGAEAYVFETLTDMLYVTITACMFQEFEETVYRNPDMTLEEMNRKFKEIQDSYDGWYYRVYGDECYEWVDIPHLFHSPMYYIGYGTSALSALDWDLAVDTYMGILHEGMDAPYKGTISKWGMRDVFDQPQMEDLARDIRSMQGLADGSEVQPGEELPQESDGYDTNTALQGQRMLSAVMILLLGVGAVIVLQVMILCVGVVVLWVLVKGRKEKD